MNNNFEVFSDIELERQFLRYVSLKDFSLAVGISSEIFFGNDEKYFFDELKKHQTNFPEKTLKKILLSEVNDSDYDDYLEALEIVLKSSDLKTHSAAKAVMDQLLALQGQRVFYESAKNAQELVQIGDVNGARLLFQEALARDGSRVDVGDYLDDYVERKSILKNRSKNDKVIVPTGLIEFDRIARGLSKGEVGLIVAQTGGGKSIGKLNFACSAWLTGYNVIHIGLEMSRTENEFRMDSMLTQISKTAFRCANLTPKELKLWDSTITDLRNRQKNYIEFVGGRGLSMTEIFSIIDGVEVRRKNKVDLVILDHILLVRRPGFRSDLYLRLMDNFQEFSDWTKDHDVASWTSVQSTDEGIKSKDGMKITDLKYGRGTGEMAQIVIALYQTASQRISNDMTARILKGRDIKGEWEIALKPDFGNMVLDTKSFYTLGLKVFKKFKGI